MKQILVTSSVFLILFSLFANFNIVSADTQSCDNRYVTLVNPVSGKSLWIDKTNNPIVNQYNVVSTNNLSATWLLQYDALLDQDLVNEVKNFNSQQELGVFLEVSPNLAFDSRVVYPLNKPWASPDVIFLSGYERSERIKIINTLFKKFSETYGYYPKSVGAWWIDSFSLNYMKTKYGISSAMIVADQKITDHYGVWGQWWGAPYFPRKENILLPADENNILDVSIIQWAQRHPDLALGDGYLYSNYSFQANDYVRLGLNTSFFKDLTKIYFDCRNKIAQITIGLETGMESVGYLNEYKKQIEYLKKYPQTSFVTMSEFSKIYKPFYMDLNEYKIYGPKTTWIMDKQRRLNLELNEKTNYRDYSTFKDTFVGDTTTFLDRRLDDKNKMNSQDSYFPLYLLLWFVIFLIYVKNKKVKDFVYASLFLFFAHGLILKSNYEFGLKVFYGPVSDNLMILQVLILSLVFLIFRIKKVLMYIPYIILSFSFDYLLKIVRYSYIEGTRYFGILIDTFRFIGLKIDSNNVIGFVNKDFEPYLADSFLKFNFNKIWNNLPVSVFIYPAIHVLIGIIIYYVLGKQKLNSKFKYFILSVLVFLTILYGLIIINSDPRIVL